MRMMKVALTGLALALTGAFMISVADPAFAAKKKHAATEVENPDRVVQPCSGGSCYRSGSQKHKKPKTDKSSS